jgi:hypothetical protein
VTSPDEAGQNSLWVVNATHPGIRTKNVVLITMCSTSPSAISFIDFFAEDFIAESKGEKQPQEVPAEEKNAQEVPTNNVAIKEEKEYAHEGEEETSPRCGHHLSGFSLVGGASVGTLFGYESLTDGQKIKLSELPEHFEIAPVTDYQVDAIRYFIIPSPGGDAVVSSHEPFQLTAASDWLRKALGGRIKIHADAFTSQVDGKFLGSCEITLEIEAPSETLSCGPGVTGFQLVNRNGERIEEFSNLRNGQVIRGSALPYGTDLAVVHGGNDDKTTLGAVKYESRRGDVYEINPPFRINSNNFHLPGNYTIKVHGYGDAEFSTYLNTCEIGFQVV